MNKSNYNYETRRFEGCRRELTVESQQEGVMHCRQARHFGDTSHLLAIILPPEHEPEWWGGNGGAGKQR